MLFNCFHCGRTISSKHEACVYCKTSTAQFTAEFNQDKKLIGLKEMKEWKEKYAGTVFGFLVKKV